MQKDLLTKNLSEVNDIRGEVLKYEHQLNRERLKCRALEDILLKPTNVHRWRLLKVIPVIHNPSAERLFIIIMIIIIIIIITILHIYYHTSRTFIILGDFSRKIDTRSDTDDPKSLSLFHDK